MESDDDVDVAGDEVADALGVVAVDEKGEESALLDVEEEEEEGEKESPPRREDDGEGATKEMKEEAEVFLSNEALFLPASTCASMICINRLTLRSITSAGECSN